jgi:hypothetical protein
MLRLHGALHRSSKKGRGEGRRRYVTAAIDQTPDESKDANDSTVQRSGRRLMRRDLKPNCTRGRGRGGRTACSLCEYTRLSQSLKSAREPPWDDASPATSSCAWLVGARRQRLAATTTTTLASAPEEGEAMWLFVQPKMSSRKNRLRSRGRTRRTVPARRSAASAGIEPRCRCARACGGAVIAAPCVVLTTFSFLFHVVLTSSLPLGFHTREGIRFTRHLDIRDF